MGKKLSNGRRKEPAFISFVNRQLYFLSYFLWLAVERNERFTACWFQVKAPARENILFSSSRPRAGSLTSWPMISYRPPFSSLLLRAIHGPGDSREYFFVTPAVSLIFFLLWAGVRKKYRLSLSPGLTGGKKPAVIPVFFFSAG